MKEMAAGFLDALIVGEPTLFTILIVPIASEAPNEYSLIFAIDSHAASLPRWKLDFASNVWL
jgi:hypothetical protein